MSANLLRGLGRFVGLIDPPKPVNQDPDRLGYLIVNEEHFMHSFHHLGRRVLRSLIKDYVNERYADVHPERLLSFLKALVGVNPETKPGERVLLLLETAIRILTFKRDKQGRVLSLYVLIEQMSLSHLASFQADVAIPKTLRDSLSSYLDGLPGFRDAMFFDEGIPIACYTHHQISLKPIQNAAGVLDRRALTWFKRELDVAAVMIKDPDALVEAHRQAKYLIHLNRTYRVMDEEDLVSQLLLRGFSTKLYRIIGQITD